ncbi:hypothetical protein EDD22DRAFT_958151 [Suillus occidentalis]|nr:hypothetical protein EDD22DRAFT_958151 [Suillus occidentalis]
MLLRFRQYNDILPQPPPSIPFSQTAQQLEFDPPTNSADRSNATHTSSQAPPFCTARNVFGLVCQFFSSTPPSHDPEEVIMLQDISYVPVTTPAEQGILSEPQDKPFFPYPNQSSFELGNWYWNGSAQKSHQSFKELIGIVGGPDFDPNDVQSTSWDKINSRLGASVNDEERDKWEDEDAGWHKTQVTIEVPFSCTTAQPGARPYIAADLYHCSLVSVMQEKLSDPQDDELFHYEPYQLRWSAPHLQREVNIQGELYTSPAFMDAHRNLQESPGEPGCNLPRSVVTLMFWSDATHLMSFGNTKLWPVYMYFGNKSKYRRCKPSCNLSNHVVYFQKLPDSFKDFAGTYTEGKGVGRECATHCHHKLFQAQWRILLDPEFLQAYKHGIVILCCDGVACRFYPRIFTYSADYPEKVLVATIWQLGGCPCPRCLIPMGQLHNLGMQHDRQQRTTLACSNASRSKLVATVCDIIYKKNHGVDSTAVETLLKPNSWVPTSNTFLDCLGSLRFNVFVALVVDLLHEFELSMWHMLFTHLLRILCTLNKDLINELDRRYRLVPPFGPATITFRFQTYKFHALGDYVSSIRHFGTTDSYSTEPNAFGFVDPAIVLRACHIIPAFSRGQQNPNECGLSPLAGDKNDWYEYYINSFVDRDTLMCFHYGLGVGHVYSHEANTPETPYSVRTQAENVHLEAESYRETTNWQASADSEDEEDNLMVSSVDPPTPHCLPFSMDMQSPSFLFTPSLGHVLQVIQPADAQHPFVGFIYEKQFGDGDFLRAIETHFCRPNAAGTASPLWLASELNDSIRFNPTAFPFGFLPPTVTNMTPLPTQSITDGQLTSALVLAPPSVGQSWSVDFDHFIDQEEYVTMASLETDTPDYFGVLAPTTQTVFNEALVWRGTDIMIDNDDRKAIKSSMNNSPWKRPLFLTKCLFQGSLWVGSGNLFDPAGQEDCVILTNCFLEAIALDHITLQELIDNLVTSSVILQSKVAHLPAGSSIGWDIIRLTFSGTIENRLLEMHKIVRRCIYLKEGFSGNSNDEQDAQIELAIVQIVRLHMYKELLYMSMLQAMHGLAEGSHASRIANFYPKEVQGENMALAKCLASTLLTIIYHTFHLWQPEKTPGRRPDIMFHTILDAVTHMYANPHQFPQFMKTMASLLFIRAENVFPMDPKSLAPRTSANDRWQRILSDVQPIVETEFKSPELPYASFTSIQAERVKEIVAKSCFTDEC